MFDDVYRVSDKLSAIPPQAVAALEQRLGIQAPRGYAEFMAELGIGTYCDLLRVYPPERILATVEQTRQRWDQYFFWEAGRRVLAKEEVLQCIIFADTIDSDEIIASPAYPDKLFVLPRHDNTIYWIEGGFADPLRWRSEKGEVQTPPAFKTFEPWNSRRYIELFTARETFTLAALDRQLATQWQTVPTTGVDTDDDVLIVFAQAVGGRFQLTQSLPDDPRVRIRIDYDAEHEHEHEIAAYTDELKAQGFYETGRSAAT